MVRRKQREVRNPFSNNGPEYIPTRDGSIDDYLRVYDGNSCMPLFRGPAMYERLRRQGYFRPLFSSIRLMWNESRGDEHFYVNEDYKLEAAEAGMHSGRAGVHEPADILKDEGPLWEAHGLRRPGR